MRLALTYLKKDEAVKQAVTKSLHYYGQASTCSRNCYLSRWDRVVSRALANAHVMMGNFQLGRQ